MIFFGGLYFWGDFRAILVRLLYFLGEQFFFSEEVFVLFGWVILCWGFKFCLIHFEITQIKQFLLYLMFVVVIWHVTTTSIASYATSILPLSELTFHCHYHGEHGNICMSYSQMLDVWEWFDFIFWGHLIVFLKNKGNILLKNIYLLNQEELCLCKSSLTFVQCFGIWLNEQKNINWIFSVISRKFSAERSQNRIWNVTKKRHPVIN